MIRAKFNCQHINQKKYAGGDSYEVVLTAVSPYNGNAEENKQFWDSTPYGEIKMNMVNKKTADAFVPGKVYFVDFTEAEDK